MWMSGSPGSGLPGAGTTRTGILARRAKARKGRPPSQTSTFAGDMALDERLGYAHGRVLGQDGVGRGAGTVAGDENGDVVGKGARMSRLAAALAGFARHAGAPALERFENEGFVRFHNSLQRLGLVERRGGQEPMPPTIGRGRVDAAALGGLGEADALDHRLRLVEPPIFLAQPGHPRPGRGVEGAPARLAAVPRQSMRPTPADNLVGAAMRAAEALDLAIADCRQRVPLDPRSLSSCALFGRNSSSGRASGDDRPSFDRRATSPSSVSASAICSPLNRSISESQSANSPISIATSLRWRAVPNPTTYIRHFLMQAGLSPEHGSQAAADPDPTAPNLLIVVDHHGAKIFQVDVTSKDASEHVIRPYDPHHFLHHLVHKDQLREQGQRAPEEPAYYEEIAQAAAAGGRIVVVGHGTGKSDAAHHLTQYLRSHHNETYQRIVREVVADVSSITPLQLLIWPRGAARVILRRPWGISGNAAIHVAVFTLDLGQVENSARMSEERKMRAFRCWPAHLKDLHRPEGDTERNSVSPRKIDPWLDDALTRAC